jgi:hypothetical protein
MIKSFQVERFLSGLGYLNDELKFAAVSPFIDVNEQAFGNWVFSQLDPTGAERGGIDICIRLATSLRPERLGPSAAVVSEPKTPASAQSRPCWRADRETGSASWDWRCRRVQPHASGSACQTSQLPCDERLLQIVRCHPPRDRWLAQDEVDGGGQPDGSAP